MTKKRIFVAGHNGMVGSAIVRKLIENNQNLEIITRSRNELDLTSQKLVEKFFIENKIDEVYIAAAKVGGIFANDNLPAEFIYQNLMIECNLINCSYLSGVKKILFLGSSCIYPRLSDQPIKEESLLSGYLEPTNEAYAIAKIAGIKLCQFYNKQYSKEGLDYRSVMPTNLYGPGDNYHPMNSHVIPAIIRKFHEAKIKNLTKVDIWGTGEPYREFLHVEDLADASIYIMNLGRDDYASACSGVSHLNIGTGVDIKIKDLSFLLKDITGFQGEINFDSSMPDGMPRKRLDISRLQSLGWNPKISLRDGLLKEYKDFAKSYN